MWRAINNNLLTALSDLEAAQSKVNKSTQGAAKKLPNYSTTHPKATIRFQGRQMALKVHSDAS